MTKVLNVFILVFAGGLLATGLLLGWGNEAGDCGSPFSPAEGASADCEALLADLRVIPLALIGTGVSLGLAVLFATGVAPVIPKRAQQS